MKIPKDKRICSKCNTIETYINKKGIPLWHILEGKVLCHRCFMNIYMKEYIKTDKVRKQRREYMKRYIKSHPGSYNRYMKDYRENHIKNGLCARCGHVSEERQLCNKCRKKVQDRYNSRKKAGICVKCGKEKPMKNQVECYTCKMKYTRR